MKRELNSRSRRKWVVGGALVFGSVALLTTGFATWVVGVQQKAADGTITVAVDSMNVDSFRVTYTASDSNIKLAETAAVDTGVIQSEATDGDFVISGTLTVVKSGETAPGTPTASLAAKKADGTTDANTANKVVLAAADTNKTGKHGENGAEKYYLATEIAVSNVSWGAAVAEGNLYKFESSITMTLSWGDYYGAAGLAAFYNSNYSVDTISGNDMEAIKAEWTAMNTALTASGALTAVIQFA